jgi:uncharacterized repeat protein (TIGR04076 family)
MSQVKTPKIVIKVISISDADKERGPCPVHKVGDEAVADSNGVHGKVCLAALASMMYKIYAMRMGANFYWLKDPNVATHGCLDYKRPVVYELTRVYE